jgi:hypothetical protein
MDSTGWIWLIVAIVVVAAGAAFVIAATRGRKSRREAKADTLRKDALERAELLSQRENKAAEMDANARAARAEADAKAAEAERLAMTAERQSAATSEERAAVDEQLQKADEIDPRVETRSGTDDTTIDDRNEAHAESERRDNAAGTR